MKSTAFLSVMALLCAAASATGAVERVRPTIPKFYLSEAGTKPVKETNLTSFKTVKVCPEHYPNGFTFRCDTVTGPTFPVVVFRVMSKVYMKERSSPYYIAGDTPMKVRPFPYESFGPKNKIMGTRLRLTCRVRTRKPVWIDVVTDCDDPDMITDDGDESPMSSAEEGDVDSDSENDTDEVDDTDMETEGEEKYF